MRNRFHLYSRFVVYFALLAISVAILPSPVAHATTFTVTNLDDAGAGSLRQEITNANANSTDDIIEFSVNGTINLLTALPILQPNGTLTINGGGVITLNRASSASSFRIIEVETAANVTLNGLTITNGSIALNGGAGIRNNGILFLMNSTVHNNVSTNRGGGIANAGTMTMTNSTVRNNSAGTIGGGGIAMVSGTMTVSNSTISNNSTTTNGGGINVSVGTITMTNSTVNNNSATTSGGGLYISGGTATIINSTLSANSAPGTSGGGIRSAGGITNLRNTIIANSPTGTNCNRSSGTINAQNSLIQDAVTPCVNGTNTSNLTAAPNLGTLTGSPAYFPLNTGSPAINAGNNTLTGGALLDQAGNTRIQGSAVDMGSFETNSLPVVTISPSSGSIAEATNANFAIARTGATTADLIVTITVTLGDANMTDSDYDLSGGSISGQVGTVTVTIPTSAASVNVNFAALDDIPAEPDNSLSIALVDDTPYDLGIANSASATIPANDLAVTVNTDDGEGSLRQAITNANAFSSNDTITFTTIGTVGLTAMLPVLANNGTLTINGGGVITVTRSSSGTFNILNVASGATVVLNNLTITNGDSIASGGGIANNGNLTVNSSIISGNNASVSGGGIANFGTLFITGSIIADNDAAGGDGIFNNGSLNATTTCIVGNGDTAVINMAGVLTATGNWWGTLWGPNIPAAPSTSGSFVSSGDSINGTGQSSSLVNVGVVMIPADYGTYSTPPVGDWLLTAPSGCPVCTNVSGTGSSRLCIIPRP